MWSFPVFLSLLTRGGVVIRMMVGAILFTSGLGLAPGPSCRRCSRVEMLCTYTHSHSCQEQQQQQQMMENIAMDAW